MPEKGPLVAASLLGAAVPLLFAVTGWIEAKTEKERADVAVEKKIEWRDDFGEYVTDRLYRDEALERALQTCLAELGRRHVGVPAEAPPTADVNLDEIAEEFGYDPEGEGP